MRHQTALCEDFTNDLKNSITKEDLVRFATDSKVVDPTRVTDIVSDVVHGLHTIFTDREHGLFGIKSVDDALVQVALDMVVDQNITQCQLVSYADPRSVSATAEVTIDAVGGITSVRITNPGSVFGIGNTLMVCKRKL